VPPRPAGRLVGGHQREAAVDLDMELDEAREAARAGAQLVHAAHAGIAAGDLLDPLAIGLGQLAIHQHVERLAADPPAAVQQVERDQPRDATVDQRLVEQARHEQADARHQGRH
jgi:hypothetical protein